MDVKIFNENKNWYYRIKKEDEYLSNESFFKRFNFSQEEFDDLNPNFEKLIAGKILFMPASSKYYHIVGPLENYETISRSFNCSVEYLKNLNKTNFLFIGQKIYIW